MRYSVLVPSYRRPELLRRNLAALAAQSRVPDEVLVALRPGEDAAGVAAVADGSRAHPGLPLRWLPVEVPGIVAAENVLIAAASGDVACFLDDDAIPQPSWLAALARHYEADPGVGGVSGPAVEVAGGAARRRRARFRNRVLFPGLVLDQSTRHTRRTVAVDHFRGANMSLLLAPLRQRGGFDPRLLGDCFRFELDACLDFRRRGLRLLFDPAVEVEHHEAPRPDGAARHSPATVYNNAANESYVFLKHYGRGPAGWLHLLYALLAGNFPCPGLAWALAASAAGWFSDNRHLRGLPYLLPAWRGRLHGWRLAAERAGRNEAP